MIVRPLLALAVVLTAPAAAASRWIATWASAQQAADSGNALPPADLTDATLRQTVHVSRGGTRLRVRFSNAFGTAPLAIDAARVARAEATGSARTIAGSDRALTFGGATRVLIPAGADYWSDPIALAVPSRSSLAVSLHLPQPPAGQTVHPGARATSYLAHGDRTGAGDLPGARTVDRWYQLAGIEAAADARGATIVTLGDSITDGHGATTNGDDRWPDALAQRLAADRATAGLAVANVGIGGNRMLLDGAGPNALARFDRDVLAQAGARAVILLEGINDLGTLTRERPASPEAHAALVRALIGAYTQIAARARAHGLKAIGGTILPDMGSAFYHPDAANEADRQALNRWIRTSGTFDAVIDFDAALRDPADPTRLQARFDSGDHLHPSPAGYRAMAAAVPLALFR